MKLLVVFLLASLIAVITTAQFDVYMRDHTGDIFDTNWPQSIAVEQFSDVTALALGQSPRSTSDPAITLTTKPIRAKASITIITQDQLPTITPSFTLTTTSKIQTPAGSVVTAVTGQNTCVMGSQSLLSSIYTSNTDSMIISFSSQDKYANDFCATLPTTTPPSGDIITSQVICSTLDSFVGNTNDKYSNPESNSAIRQIVSLSSNNDFTKLTTQFNIEINNDNVIINDVTYSRSNNDVNTIIRELAYMVNIASQLSTFGDIITDTNVDIYTFVISSASNVENNGELIKFIERVITYTIDQYTTTYNSSLLSSIIMSKTPLIATEQCQTNLGGSTTIGQVVVTTEQVRSYQITLWLTLGLIAIAVLSFSATATMHILPDPALQGGVSTFWTHKK